MGIFADRPDETTSRQNYFHHARQGSKINLTHELKQFITLEHYHSPEAKMWAILSETAARKFGANLPAYSSIGGYFRLLPDGRATAIIDLEEFSHQLRKYFAHKARDEPISVTGFWT